MTTTKQIDPLKDLLTEELRDLLHAEGQLVKALPKMAEAAHNPKLKEGFLKHLKQTEGHVERLKEAFELLGEKAQAKPCKAMMGLVDEGKETIEEGEDKDGPVADLALIVAAHKVEHYEISGYSSVRSLAIKIGAEDVANLLRQTLAEEEATATTLADLSAVLMTQAGSAAASSSEGRAKAHKA
jgi:Mn-containing catalase